MTLAGLVDSLREQGVELWTEGDRLRYSAPKGMMTPALRQQLSERKAELLQYLQSAGPGTILTPPPVRPVPRDG